MKKYLALLLVVLTVLALGLTACTPTTKDPVNPPVKSEGTEETPSQGSEPETGDDLGTYVDLKDYKASEESRQAVLGLRDSIEAFETIRRDLIILPCNKQFYDKMEAAIQSNRQYVERFPEKLYTVETYSKGQDMEAAWHEVFKMNAAGLSAGFIKEQGWYQKNISIEQGDYYMALDRNDPEKVLFDILDPFLKEQADAGNAVDAAVVAAFKDVTFDLLTGPCTTPGYEHSAKWTSQTTDCDCRLIEQIFYDMIGEGIDGEGNNNNPMCIEQGRKPYKEISQDVMKASLIMLSDKYAEVAETYPALAPYAEKYAAYANAWGAEK